MLTLDQTIGDFIMNVPAQRFCLPAHRPDLLWGTERIERLFDSLLRGYPIGAMVRWLVPGKHYHDINGWGLIFYEVPYAFDERAPHSREADLGEPICVKLPGVVAAAEHYAVLDGRQRLTALFTGMIGSYIRKEPRSSENDASASPRLELHVNLLHQPAPGHDMKFGLSFRQRGQAAGAGEFWFRVRDILDVGDDQALRAYRRLSGHGNSELFEDNLAALFKAVWVHEHIHFITETRTDLDEAIRIFNCLHDLQCH
jgi:hypothetical protein